MVLGEFFSNPFDHQQRSNRLYSLYSLIDTSRAVPYAVPQIRQRIPHPLRGPPELFFVPKEVRP